MLLVKTALVLLSSFSIFHGAVAGSNENELLITMPNVSPQEETRLNHAFKLDPDYPIYITGFVEQLQYATHGLILACREPFSDEGDWEGAFACKDSLDTFLFSTGKNASNLHYPRDIGLKVGGDSGFMYLVMQTHYADAKPFHYGAVDRSRMKILYTVDAPQHLAGHLMLQSSGYILPGEEEHFESALAIDEDVVLHPFLYRVHTHSLGQVVSAYRVRGDQWTEIVRRSPQMHQNYIPSRPVTLRKGDILAVRCTLFNFEDHTLQMGNTKEGEMCYFYLVYYVDGTHVFSKSTEISEGPPNYYWRLDERLDTSNIPADASEIPPPPDGPDPDPVDQQGPMSHVGMH